MNPTRSSYTPPEIPVLNDVAISYMPPDARFIADQVAPVLTVSSAKGAYPIFTEESYLRIHTQPRPPGTPGARKDYDWDFGSLDCHEYGVGVPVTDEDIDEAITLNMPILDPLKMALKTSKDDVMMWKEQKLASNIFST